MISMLPNALSRNFQATDRTSKTNGSLAIVPSPAALLRTHERRQDSRIVQRRTAMLDAPHKTQEKSGGETNKKGLEEYEDDDFEDFDAFESESSFSTEQVQELMSVVCNETKFAEIELKVGAYAVRARRLPAGLSASEQVVSSTAPAIQAPELPSSANELPFQSTASIDESQILTPPPKPSSSVSSMDEDDYDENLLYIGAPKVGILRRGRYVKGRRIGKGPIAEEGSRVKKGQPLAFIEQLGTFVPVEAPQAGEISSFKIEDGKPVEYKDVIVEISPFFGGHIIGDRKYA